jgi:hypothetical protein
MSPSLVVPSHVLSILLRTVEIVFFMMFVVQHCDSEQEETLYFRIAFGVCVCVLLFFIAWDIFCIIRYFRQGGERQTRVEYVQIQ